MPLPSAKGAWEGVPAVSLGRVDRTRLDRRLFVQHVRLRVEEAFKGVKTGELVELPVTISSCSPGFVKGMRLVFYLGREEGPGGWRLPICYRLRELSAAADDLLFLRALPGSAGRNRLPGTAEYSDPER